jgi:c-di-GMP-binding flagellar brake protein YcgR
VLSAPDIHRLVTISDLQGRQFRSRIEDVSSDLLVLARPLDLPVEHEFGIGETVLVSWPDPGGITRAQTELLDSRARGPVGLWTVRVLNYQREQRRRFVRVPALGPVQLALIPAEAGVPFTHIAGHLVDVSEAAIRCAVKAEEAGDFIEDTEAVVNFALGTLRFEIIAIVLKVEAGRHEHGTVEVVLAFDLDEDQAATVRRGVFAEQLRIRNG